MISDLLEFVDYGHARVKKPCRVERVSAKCPTGISSSSTILLTFRRYRAWSACAKSQVIDTDYVKAVLVHQLPKNRTSAPLVESALDVQSL